MSQKIKEFKYDLKLLLEKHKVSIEESEQYDGEDNYCGSVFYFKVDSEIDYSESIAEFIESIKHAI